MLFEEKHVIRRWTIEEKPGGGFLARCQDPPETIEAATRGEIQARIRERLKDLMGPAFSDLDLSKLPLDQPGSVVKTPMRAKFTFSLGTPGTEKPINLQPRLQDGSPGAIESKGSSLLSAMWKAAVLVGIAIIIWLLLKR